MYSLYYPNYPKTFSAGYKVFNLLISLELRTLDPVIVTPSTKYVIGAKYNKFMYVTHPKQQDRLIVTNSGIQESKNPRIQRVLNWQTD